MRIQPAHLKWFQALIAGPACSVLSLIRRKDVDFLGPPSDPYKMVGHHLPLTPITRFSSCVIIIMFFLNLFLFL